MVWCTPQSGSWQLHAADLASGTSRQVTDLATGLTDGEIEPCGAWIWWFDGTDGAEHGMWRRQAFSGGTVQDIGLPAAYSTGLFLAEDFAVVGTATGTGTVVHLVRRDGTMAVVHRSETHVDVEQGSADGSLFVLAEFGTGPDGTGTLKVVDERGQHVADSTDRIETGLVPGSWSPVPGDQRLIVHHQGDDMVRPMIWSPATAAFQGLDIQLDGNLTGSWYPDAAALAIRRELAGRSTLHRYDIRTGLIDEFDTEPGSIHAAGVRPGGDVWYLHSSGSTPQRLLSTGQDPFPQRADLAAHGTAYRDLRVGDVHCFTAEPTTPPPHPTILALHGGPELHDRDEYCPRVQSWVDAGFAVVLVNYRGSSGYGHRWQDALRHPPGPGFVDLADVLAVRAYLVERGFADPHKIVLQGGSWGGYLVLMGLGLQPDLWAAGIAVVPVADWQAGYEFESEFVRAHDNRLFGGTPTELPDYYAERSPLTYADRVRAPLLIIAGRNDAHCPHQQIMTYVQRLRLYGKRFVLHEFYGGHGALDVAEQLAQQEKQILFARCALSEAGFER
jgi:acetyl esterase/lipase